MITKADIEGVVGDMAMMAADEGQENSKRAVIMDRLYVLIREDKITEDDFEGLSYEDDE